MNEITIWRIRFSFAVLVYICMVPIFLAIGVIILALLLIVAIFYLPYRLLYFRLGGKNGINRRIKKRSTCINQKR